MKTRAGEYQQIENRGPSAFVVTVVPPEFLNLVVIFAVDVVMVAI